MSRVLVITDNGLMLRKFRQLLRERFGSAGWTFEFKRSFTSTRAKLYEDGIGELEEINVKTQWPQIVERYDLVLSVHCKQIFPSELVRGVRCVNVHPGYNPYNRGWYPQVFSIITHTIIGATIHEMDEEIDRGRIIARREVPILATDTSLEVYERVLEMEMTLLSENLQAIVENSCQAFEPESEGVYHTRKEFDELCQLDMGRELRFRDAIDLLRGLTHGNYANAYFRGPDGKKIFVGISLSGEKN